jgi:hypothetical protein
MDGDYASVTRRQMERGELASVFVRLGILVCLTVLYAATSRADRFVDLPNVLVAVAVVVSIGFSSLCLRLLSTSTFTPLLADVSAALDAAVASLFLWLALGVDDHPRSVALAAAAAVALPSTVVLSLLRVGLRNTVVAGSAALAGSTAAVIAELAREGATQPHWGWVFVPVGCAAVALAACSVAASTQRLLLRHLVTADLQRASRRLRMTMEIVQVSVANFGQFVNNLERISTTLSDGARNQARSIDRISSAIAALNSSQEQIYHSTEISAKTIRRTVDSSETGNNVVKRVIDEVRSITDVVSRMVSSLERIDDIADNTNLLALNANIEANRGGGESMGFSVVADEIRNLAEQSRETAIEVGRLVKQIAKVIFMADASSRNAGEVFEKITTDLAGYSEYVNTLHLSVQEQLKANRDVQRAISRIHEVTMDNTKAADHVSEVVGQLQTEVAKLKALVDGKVTETAGLS